MRRRNLAASIATALCALSFIVIGSCFTAFKYKDEMIKVESPKIVASEGISVFNSEGDKTISSLKLTELKLGLKPATGEEDPETNIPSTVHDKKGSEGEYACFKIYAPKGAKIYVQNIKIENRKNPDEANAERENIYVAVKEIKNSTKNLVDDRVYLGDISASDERQEHTFYVWLDAKAGKKLMSSTISFEVSFESLT